MPGKLRCSTSVMVSSFSVLMTALFQVSGMAPPVYPVPPPRGMMVKPNSMQALTMVAISASESGVSTTNGYSTRQSVASVTCDTRLRPSNLMLSAAVHLRSTFCALRRKAAMRSKFWAKPSTAEPAASSKRPTHTSRCASSLGVRRFCTSAKRWCKASTNKRRRPGLSSKSSCK